MKGLQITEMQGRPMNIMATAPANPTFLSSRRTSFFLFALGAKLGVLQMPRKRVKVPTLDSCEVRGKVIKPGDCVTLKAPDADVPSYVARVEHIYDARDGAILHVRWYYRPEESAGGRRQFHGSKELFLSDHYDNCSPEAVESLCTVHSFKDYTRLDHVDDDDFYCRFEYKAASGTFIPDRVAVYCVCEMPYNPDELMVQCEKCRDWFHPKCVEKTPEEIRQLYHFFCPSCCTF